MAYADPRACPSCAAPITGAERCPACRVRLASPEAGEVWRALTTADRLVEAMRAEAAAFVTRQPPAPRTEALPPFPAAAGPRVERRAPRWNAGAFILALGALCLVVAAFIFVSVSWDAIELWGRTLILVAVTVIVGGVSAWVTLRGLRASAEALWSVLGGMVTLDYFAGRAAGLVGLDDLRWSHSVAVYGVLLVGLAVGVGAWARRTGMRLACVEVAMILGTVAACSGAHVRGVTHPVVWSSLVATALGLALCAVMHRAGFARAAFVALGAPAVAYVVAVVAALVVIADHPDVAELWGDGHAVPMAVVIVLTAAAGFLVRRRALALERLDVADHVATFTAAAGVLGAASFVFVPAAVADDRDVAQVVLAALAVVPAVAFLRLRGPWGLGARLGALACALPLVMVGVAWVGAAVDTVVRSAEPAWNAGWRARLEPGDLPASAWCAAVTFGALALTVAVVRLWRLDALEHDPSFRSLRDAALPTSIALAVAAGALQLVLHDLPVVVVAGALLLVAVAAIEHGAQSESTGWLAGATGVLLVASLVPLASQVASGVVWLAAAVLFAAIAVAARHHVVRPAAVVAAVVEAVAGALALATATSVSDDVLRLIVLLVALGALVAATLLRRRPVLRIALECGAGALAAVDLAVATEGSLGWQSLLWCIVGASLVGLALLVDDRRPAGAVGTASLVLAYGLLLASHDVDVVEAYTAPIGVGLLVAGLWAMTLRPDLSTWWALSPGLAVSLLPSLLPALDDPTSVRALVLGIAGVVVLGVGVRRRWIAPFWFGLVVAVLVVVFNIGPYADAVPRWVVIAVVGVLLLGVGITWEARVRDARSALAYLRDLR